MNRTLVIGGVAAIALLLGIAAWLLLSGKSTSPTTEPGTAENAGPIELNDVAVVKDHTASEADEGRKLKVAFPSFEVTAKSGQTASAVFSTTWRLKLTGDQRAVVAAATLTGFMKSTAPAPQVPAPPPEPAASAPATTDATTAPPADGTTAATTPAAPAQPAPPPAPPKPVAGDGVARVVVTVGTETFVTEWTDLTGEGAAHKIAKAAALSASPIDLRAGSTIPVTVALEVTGGREGDATAKIDALDLQLFAEDAPLPAPPSAPSPPDSTKPAEPAAPPAEPTPPPPANP